MKLPEFNYSKMQWDAWNAFHVNHKYSTFIQFDTGEFVVCHRRWAPEERRVYNELHIQIITTEDDGCPKLYVPGSEKPIPKSHLNPKGQQTLLLDLDHKRAVSLDSWLTSDNAPSIPERFTKHPRIAAWYAGPNALPVGTPIVRRYPQALTYDQRKHVNELVDACKVWLQMQPDIDTLRREQRYGALPVLDYVATTFAMLTIAQRTIIATSGFNMLVKEEYHWLTFE